MKMRLIILGLSVCFTQFSVAEEKEIEIDSYQFELKNSKKMPTDTSKKISDKKPELADYTSYNNFLNAMYLYKKSQEAATKPELIINLPAKQQSTPESSAVEPSRDISNWGEEITATPPPLDD